MQTQFLHLYKIKIKMKTQLCIFFTLLFTTFAQPLLAQRFWVSGGTGNWNSTTNWSATSGGASGVSVPTATDDVFFDAASGVAGYTATLDAASTCRSLNFTGVNAMTLAGIAANALTVNGNLTMVANVTTTFAGDLIFDDNLAGVNSIITANKTFLGNITFNSATVGAAWQVQATNSLSSAIAINLLQGDLDVNGQIINAPLLNANSALARTLSLGVSAITLTGAGTILDLRGANLTYTVNTATLAATNAGNVAIETGDVSKIIPTSIYSSTGTITINTSAVAANTITFGNITASTVTNFNVTGTGSISYAIVNLANSVTATFGGNNATFTSALNLTSAIATFSNTGNNIFSSTFTTTTSGTTNFTNTAGNNTFTGAVVLNSATNLSNVNNIFSSTINLATTRVLTFNATTNNTFAGNLAMAINTTVQFSTRAGTSNTFTGAASIVPTGDCTNPPTSFVKVQSAIAATAARVTFAIAQTWANTRVQDITNVAGATVTANAANADGGNNTAITFISSATGTGRNLFWVGGTGNWSDVNRWSLSSGGAGGECIPTIFDNVTVDNNSIVAAAGFTITFDVDAVCKSVNMSALTTAGKVATLSGVASRTWTVGGNFNINTANVIQAGITNFLGKIIFVKSSNFPVSAAPFLETSPATISINSTTALRNFANIDFNSTANGGTGLGSWTLATPINTIDVAGANGLINYIDGTLNTNSQAVLCRRLSSISGSVRNLILGTSTITVTGLLSDNSTPTIDFSGDNSFSISSGATASFVLSNTSSGNITINTGVIAKTIPLLNYTGTFTNITLATSNTPANTLTINGITVVNPVTAFTVSGFSNKTLTAPVLFNSTTGATSVWNGNTTFNTGANLTFIGVASLFTFNNTVTSSANITSSAAGSAFTFANAFTHNAGNTFSFAGTNNLTFTGIVNNTYAIMTGVGAGHILNFNNTGNNDFNGAITVGTTSAVTFATTTDNNNFAANFTAGMSSTLRFSTNAGTSNTFAAGANLIPLGDCSNPPLSYVNIRSTTNATVARLTFGTAQVWNHVLVTDIDNVLGQTVTVNALNGDGGNNTNIIFVSSTTGRTLYWSQRGAIAGSQNWSDPNSWSLSATGLPVGECPPTINDIVIVNNNSYTVNGNTMNIDVAANCRTMDWQITTASRNPIITNTLGLRIAENLTLPIVAVGTDFSGVNSTITLSATLATAPTAAVAALIGVNRFIQPNGTTTLTNANVTINDTGLGVTWTLEGNFQLGTATTGGILTLTQGHLKTINAANTTANTLTTRQFLATGAATRTLTFANATVASTINIADNTGATIFDISGTAITTNATNAGVAPFSTINFTGNATNTINLGTLNLALGNFNVTGITAKILTVNTPTTPQILTFNNIDVQTLTDITFNGTSPKTINDLTVRTPNTTIGFDMAGNTIVNGAVDFNTNVITRFRNTATFQTSADVIDYGANGVGIYDGLLTTNRAMTFATSTAATIISLTTNAGMTFNNANLTFGSSFNNTTAKEIENIGTCTFTGTSNIIFDNNFNATFGGGAGTDNMFRDILANVGGNSSDILFSNTGTNSIQNVTIRNGSTWAFSIGGTTSVAGLFRVIAICTARVSIISNSLSVCATTNFATAGQTWDNIGLLRDVTNIGSAITVNTAVNPSGACTAGFNTTTQYRNLFWVGKGTATPSWGVEANWSLVSNGAGGECPPTINDDVNFDANSFSAAGQTCILTGLAATSFYECRNMNWTGATNNPIFNQNNTELTIGGNLTFVAGMSLTNTANSVVFNPQSDIVVAPRTITMAGKSFGTAGAYFRDLNGTPSTWTLQDAFATTGGIFLAGGTLITNNQTVAATLINANPVAGVPFGASSFTRGGNNFATLDAARTLNLGTSVVTLSGGTSTIMDFRGNTTNFTLNAGTSQIILSNTAASTRTIEMGTVAKNLYNLRSLSPVANVTVTINANGVGTYGFNDVEFLNTGASTVTVNVNNNTSAKTFNSILFGNNTTSTFLSTTMTVANTTTYGTNTRTTVNPVTSATFTGLVTIGSTANAAGAADFQRATFNGTPTSLTYTNTTVGLFADTRFTTCTITNATTSATPSATMRFQGNNTFVATTGTLTFANTSTPMSLLSNTANAGTQIFGGAVLVNAVAMAGAATINLTGNTLFNNSLTVNSNTATATFGTTTASNTTIFKEAVNFNGANNIIVLNSVANELNGYVAFTDAFNIAGAGLQPTLTTNGIVFFRQNVSIGNGALTLTGNNIIFNGRIDQRNAPVNWGTSSTPAGVGAFTTTVFGAPTKTWTNGNTTDNTTGTSAGSTFILGNDNRVSFAGTVDCGLRNFTVGNRTICNINNTGTGMSGLHTIDNITLNPFAYFQIPSKDVPAVGLNPVVRVTNVMTIAPTCSEWVSVSSTTSGVQGSFCFKINQTWQRSIIQDIAVLSGGALPCNGTVLANDSQDAGNNTIIGTTITFIGIFGNEYYWMGGRGASATQNNNWSNFENWSKTYPAYSNPTSCTPTAGDIAYYTNVSFPNNNTSLGLPAAYGSFCDVNVPFVYIKDMIWIEDLNNNNTAETDTTNSQGNISGVPHTGATFNMARLRATAVGAPTIEVYGRLKLPGGVLNQFPGTFSMQSAGLGGGTFKAIQNPKAGQFFGPLAFNAPDRWFLTDNIDCNNNGNGSITFNLGELLAKGKNINLQGNFTINVPPSPTFNQSQIKYNACGGAVGVCNATVTFDGIANNQTMSMAGIQGALAPTTTTTCNGTYNCGASANLCAVSPFNNLTVNKRNTFPSVTINTFTITVNKDLTITKGELIDNGNQIRGNTTNTLTIGANSALRLGNAGTATVFPTCYTSDKIILSNGTNGTLAAQTLTNGAISTAAADSSQNASIVEYIAGINQLVRGTVTVGSADPATPMTYGTLILSGGNGAAATKVYKDMLNVLTVNGSLIVRSGSVFRDMGFQITGSSATALTNRIRVEGAGQLYLGTGVAASTSVTYQPILNTNVTAAFQTPTATANAVTTFPTYTPIADMGVGKMDLNNIFTGTGANSPTIDGVSAGGANLDVSAYSTVAYAANANQNVLAGFTYGNLALTNAAAARIKTVVGATLGTTILALGGNLLIQSNHEFRDAGFQIIGNGNVDGARIGSVTSVRVARIRMEATTTLRLGITRTAAGDFNTFFPTYASAGSLFTQGTPVANRNNNNRSLDPTSTVIYDAGNDYTAVAPIDQRRMQRIDGGFTYGNVIITNSAAPTGDKALGLRYLDADLGTPASNGIAGNLTIGSYIYLYDNDFQMSRTAAGGVFTMQPQSAFRIGGAFSTVGGTFVGVTAGTATTAFPLNFPLNNTGRSLDITSTIVYGRAGIQNVEGGTVAPTAATAATNFNYGSLVLLSSGTKTNIGNPFIAANLHIANTVNYTDAGFQIFGNATASTLTSMPAVLDLTLGVTATTPRAMTVEMVNNATLTLGTATKLTTFPLFYPAARMGATNLASTSTVTYNGGVTGTAGGVNHRQIVASGFSYGNLAITNSNTTLTALSDKWLASAATITNGATNSTAWTNALFGAAPPATVGAATVATGGEVLVKGDLTINVSNRLYDDGVLINNSTASTGTLNLAVSSGATDLASELYLGNAGTTTLFPKFNTVQLNPTATAANKNLVVYNSNQATTITGLNALNTAFSYNNLTLSSTNAVTKTLNSAITVRGNLTIGGGTGVNATTAGAGSVGTEANTLDVSGTNHNITLSGNWNTEAAGVFDMRANTVIFDGNTTENATPAVGNSSFQTITARPTAAINRFATLVVNNLFGTPYNTAAPVGAAIRVNTVPTTNSIRIKTQVNFINGHVGGISVGNPNPITSIGAKAATNTNIATVVSTNTPLMIFEQAATVTGSGTYAGLVGATPKNDSHVIGVVEKISDAGTNFIFPVGSGKDYAPIGLVNPTASGSQFRSFYIGLSPFSSYPSNIVASTLSHASYTEFWELERISGAANSNILLSWFANGTNSGNRSGFNVPPNPMSGGVNIPTDLRVGHWTQPSDNIWNDEGNSGIGGGSTVNQGTLTSSVSVNSFSPFTLASISKFNPLPVTLVSFTALPKDNKVVELKWETVEERTNSFFTIERSIDGTNFAALKSVPSKAVNGNSTGSLKYTDIDEKPYKGTSYYRLRQVDIDGTVKYSKIVSVNFEGNAIDPSAEGFIVYPNPNDGSKVNIKFTDILFEKAEIAVFDMLGREIYRTVVAKNGDLIAIDFLSKLPSGQYVIRFVTEAKSYNKAFIVE